MERWDEIQSSNSIASTRFRLDQWFAYGVGFEEGQSLIAHAGGTSWEHRTLTQATLPAMLRRRVSAIGQMAFRASNALSVPATARFIFCSRHGEFKRTLGILNSLVRRETVSPAEFSLSVHNALVGLLSIVCHNTSGHTAISAGADTFGCALLEATSCLISRPGEPVLLVYFDDRLPEPYAEIAGSAETCIALALLLEAPRDDAEDLIFGFAPVDAAISTLSASGQSLDFLRFLRTGVREGKSVGERMEWRWRRA